MKKRKNKTRCAGAGCKRMRFKSRNLVGKVRQTQQLTYTTSSWLNIMATYDSLHRQCRTLESLFDAKLTSYSRLASTISRNDSDIEASGSGERWKDLQNEVEDLLENVCLLSYDSFICIAQASDFACHS